MSVKAIKAIYDANYKDGTYKKLTLAQHAVLVNLAFHKNDTVKDETEACYPSENRITAEIGCCKRTVQAALTALVKQKKITRLQPNKKESCRYVLHLSANLLSAAEEDADEVMNRGVNVASESSTPCTQQVQTTSLRGANSATNRNSITNKIEVVDSTGDTPAPPSAAAVFNSREAEALKTTNEDASKYWDERTGLTKDGKPVVLKYDVEAAVRKLSSDPSSPRYVPRSFIEHWAEILEGNNGFFYDTKGKHRVKPNGFTTFCEGFWGREIYKETYLNQESAGPKTASNVKTFMMGKISVEIHPTVVKVGDYTFEKERYQKALSLCAENCIHWHGDDKEYHCSKKQVPPFVLTEQYQPMNTDSCRFFHQRPEEQ